MAKNNPIREQYEALTGSLAQSPRVCRWEELLEWPHGPGGKRAVIFCGANPWSQAILNKSKILATAGWKIHGWSTCVCVCVGSRRLSQERVTALFSHSVRVPRGSSDVWWSLRSLEHWIVIVPDVSSALSLGLCVCACKKEKVLRVIYDA